MYLSVDSYIRVVAAQGHKFSERQMKAVLDGIQRTQRTVPHVEGPHQTGIVLRREKDWERPIGLVALFPIEFEGENFAEIGVRFWEPTNVKHRVLLHGLYALFEHYRGAIARVYASNRPVKGLLQRGGFRLMKRWKEQETSETGTISRTIELYGVKREEFYALWDGER